MQYCKLCGGNEELDAVDTMDVHDGIGPLCRPLIEGPLAMAYEAYKYVEDSWGHCCGGMSSDISFGRTLAERIKKYTSNTHLYLHPNSYGDSDYYVPHGMCLDCYHEHGGTGDVCVAPVETDPPSEETDVCPCGSFHGETPTITVECGISFGPDGATCYWIFDNDTIGLVQAEPLDGGPVSYAQDGESFLAALADILSTAAEQAYMSDHLQCAVCGGIYYSSNGPCCEGGDPDLDAPFDEV
jgi:hypothetical protein